MRALTSVFAALMMILISSIISNSAFAVEQNATSPIPQTASRLNQTNQKRHIGEQPSQAKQIQLAPGQSTEAIKAPKQVPHAYVSSNGKATSIHDRCWKKPDTKIASIDRQLVLVQNKRQPEASIERVSLLQLARETMAIHFHQSHFKSLKDLLAGTPVCADYKEQAGVFVTVSRNGKTRACWGAIYPVEANLVAATIATTEALTKEYRYPPVRESEWKFLKAQVTIVRAIEPISDMSQQNPMQYGLLVRYAGRGAVFLPGEAADAHYQLVRCKLKAGIPVNQPCQMYRIQADVLK